MRVLLGAFAFVLLAAGLASADDKPAQSPQSRQSSVCSTQASNQHLTGDARKQFMSECLRKHAAARDDASSSAEKDSHSGTSTNGEHHSSQSEKMKTCNHEASTKNLHGDERKSFMSQCLKGDKKS
jgi:hypothetical protein